MFSIIIPTYNREKELIACIDSVLNQSFEKFEVIIVDNGSTDGTKNIVHSYQDQDKRVRYYWQENTGSPAGSRNTGIRHAKYEWIAFLDSDDYWFKNKLEEVKNFIDNNKNDDLVLVSHYEEQHINGKFSKVLKHGKWLRKNIFNELLYKGNCLSTSAIVTKTKSVREIGGFDTRTDYFAVEDYDLWMRLAKIGTFGIINKALGVFSVSSKNMSGNIELINSNLKTLIFNKIDNLPLSDKKKIELKIVHGSRVEYYKGRGYLLEREFDKSRQILFKSFIAYPWSFKKALTLVFSIIKVSK